MRSWMYTHGITCTCPWVFTVYKVKVTQQIERPVRGQIKCIIHKNLFRTKHGSLDAINMYPQLDTNTRPRKFRIIDPTANNTFQQTIRTRKVYVVHLHGCAVLLRKALFCLKFLSFNKTDILMVVGLSYSQTQLSDDGKVFFIKVGVNHGIFHVYHFWNFLIFKCTWVCSSCSSKNKIIFLNLSINSINLKMSIYLSISKMCSSLFRGEIKLARV